MTELVVSAYGQPAMRALAAAVEVAKDGDPLAPVLVVVGADRVGVAVRRGLARSGIGNRNGIAGVSPITLRRLAEMVATPALTAAGRLPVTRPVLVGAIDRLLRDDPGAFVEVADHPDTARTLAVAHDLLRPLDAVVLAAVAEATPIARDVVRVHRDLSARLAPSHYDEVDLLVCAADLVARGERSYPPIVVFLPRHADPAQERLVRALADRGRLTVIVGRSGVDSQDAALQAAWARLLGIDAAMGSAQAVSAGDATGSLHRGSVGSAGKPPAAPTADAIFVATDPDDEAREVVRLVLTRLAAGVPGHRIGVLYGSRQPYARLLAEHLDQAGIVVHGRGVRPASERMLGRSLRRLLGLAQADFRRDEVMALLAEGPVQWQGRRAPASAWERLSRDAGVVRAADWAPRLAALQERHRELARVRSAQGSGEDRDVAADTGRGAEGARDTRSDQTRDAADSSGIAHAHPPGHSAESRESAPRDEAADLAAFVADLQQRMDDLAAARTWTEATPLAQGLWTDVLGSGSGSGSLGKLPDEELRVADAIDRIVRSLPSLDALGAPYSLGALRELVEAELDAELDRVGRNGIGVHVAPISDGVGLTLDAVFLVGLAEGLYPARPADDPLLPDPAREPTGGVLPTLRERIARQHHDFLAALASAPAGSGQEPRRTMTFPRGDLRRGGVRVPSRWVVPTLARLSGRPDVVATEWRDAARNTDAIRVGASYSAAVLGAAVPGTEQEWRLRAYLAGPVPQLLALEARAREMRSARRGHALTRFDGLVGPHPWLAEQLARELSASALETWLRCPHQYLVRQLLGVRAVENPEEIVQISALDKGSLLHGVLERFFHESLAAQDVPGAGAPWSNGASRRMQSILEDQFAGVAASGRVGLVPLWEDSSRGFRSDLLAFLGEDDKRRASEALTPIAAELAFGRLGGPPVEIALPEGGSVRLAGSIDRIDEGPGGLVVLDYKTGKSDRYKGLSAADPTGKGTYLQLALYAIAARQVLDRRDAPVAGGYWFITRAHCFEQVCFPLDDTSLRAARDVLGMVVGGIRAGLFPPRPKDHSKAYHCEFCNPDDLGDRTPVDRFEALLASSLLAGYRAVLAGEAGIVAGPAGAPGTVGTAGSPGTVGAQSGPDAQAGSGRAGAQS